MNATVFDLATRAEWYLCLARAFLPPKDEATYRALAEYLADDLAEVSASLGYAVAGTLSDFRVAMQSVPGPQSLLQDYSKLFLTPPMPVSLNAGLYLDGAVMGGSVEALEDYYRRHGVARSEDFHDLPDHVSVQLEYLAYLFGSAAGKENADEVRAWLDEAGGFLKWFVLSWAPSFCAALERAVARHEVTGIYLYLARLLRAAAEHDAGMFYSGRSETAEAADSPSLQGREADDSTGHKICCACGTSFIQEEQLEEIIAALQRQGLSTEHLEVCPTCRSGEMGL